MFALLVLCCVVCGFLFLVVVSGVVWRWDTLFENDPGDDHSIYISSELGNVREPPLRKSIKGMTIVYLCYEYVFQLLLIPTSREIY